MEIGYESHSAQGVYVSDENGEHNFANEEEYQAYRKEKFDKLPIICDTCIYHLQENKKKFKCPLDRNSKNIDERGKCEGNIKGCSYYRKNPKNWKEWYRIWYKPNWISQYWYYRRSIERKLRIGFYRSWRKFFFYGPSLKYPYFQFVHRTRNEYEDECNVYHIGWISKENSYYKKATFFEKFYWTQYHFHNEHINYEYALCTDDYYVTTFNNVKTNDCMFKCHQGEIYQVRPIRKYKYYDILRNKTYGDEEYELRMKGQVPEDEFNKHFRIPEHEELIKLLEERNKKKNNGQESKEQPKGQSVADGQGNE